MVRSLINCSTWKTCFLCLFVWFFGVELILLCTFLVILNIFSQCWLLPLFIFFICLTEMCCYFACFHVPFFYLYVVSHLSCLHFDSIFKEVMNKKLNLNY